ncbi:MAG: amidohydrolase family protein [Longimicrobiales bacterium]
MIIDCHTHLNKYEDDDSVDLARRYEALRREMDENEVDYALILSSYLEMDERPPVRQILDIVEGDEDRVGVVAGVSYLHYSARDLADLHALLADGRLKGLKLYPGYEPFYVHDPRMRVVYELAAEFHVPVMIHSGDTFDPRGRLKYAHPIEVDEVAVDFPDVTFVICHLGNPWITDAMEVIYKNDNVVGDISGFTLRAFEERFERHMLAQVRGAIAFAGNPRDILFGTDWPLADMGSYIRFVRNLELSEDEVDMVLWRNAARIFGIEAKR